MSDTGPIHDVIERWHAHLRGQGSLDDLLHDDVTFFSPIVYTPQEGKAVTMMYLQAAGQTLPGDRPEGAAVSEGSGGFRYTKQVLAGDTAVLEFETWGHALAVGPGVNPIGDAALARASWSPERCTCAEPGAARGA